MSRRSLLQAAAAGGLGALAAGAARPLLPLAAGAPAAAQPLKAAARTIEVDGRAATVFGLEGPKGSHGLEFAKGDRFAVTLTNALAEDTLVHWHGLTPPANQDGVPVLSQHPLGPGRSHGYDFPLDRAGTFWMHSHLGLQEQRLLAAPLIVRDPAEARADEQEVVVMLHDFSFRDPAEILAELRSGGGAHAGHANHAAAQPVGGGVAARATPMPDHEGHGSHGRAPGAAVPGGPAEGKTAARPAALNDVAYDAFLANDRTLADPEVVRVEAGGRVRLRIINGAAASNLWIDLGSLRGELIAVDGNPVHPVRGSRFPLAIAQRLDIRLALPKAAGAWPVFALLEGLDARTGLVLATRDAAIAKLGTAAGAAAPALDLGLERTLKALDPLPLRPAERSEVVELTGGAADYLWTLNGAPPDTMGLVKVREGERIEIGLHNRTAMAHPMHLHGHLFQVVGIGRRRFAGALRDTVLVPPRELVTIAFDAVNPGRWAFHCHHLYHMAAGMMTSIDYASAA